jgi:putative Holliday junction resolvase
LTDGKLLGIDHGLARIGLAVSDASRLVARELVVIKHVSKAEDFGRINQIAVQEKVVALVVGVPWNPERAEGLPDQAAIVRKWIAQLAETTPLPIVQWDEQMTSVDAKELARQKRRKPRDPIDDLAARVMLQSYLDALRDGLA